MKSLGAKTIGVALPAWVIGSYDVAGRPNVMTASWAGICCSRPPQAYFSARESRYTYECVMARKAFSINVPSVAQAPATDYFGTASGRNVDKLAVAGMTAVPSEHVDAPYIAEFPLVLECRLLEAKELGIHTMFIGEIMDVKCSEEMLDANGNPDTAKITPFIYATGDSTYHAVSGLLGSGYQLGANLQPNKDG